MAKFKNTADQTLTVEGFPPVKAGEIVELPDNFHNANFERVDKKEKARDEHDLGTPPVPALEENQ